VHVSSNLAAQSPVPLSINGSRMASAGKASGGHASAMASQDSGGGSGGSSGETASATVQALQREIAQLQQALAREQAQLQAAQQRADHDEAARIQVLALHAEVNTTAGALAVASAELVAAIQAQGGGSKGALVNAQA
jgi:hypothetical protein